MMLVVSVRLVHLQHVIPSRFLAPWDRVVSEEEIIPCRDGRIVAADGVVLAQDEVRYDVTLDYRWLQSPADPHWLRGQALRELLPRDRRSSAARKAAEERILARREALLENLAAAAQVSNTQLQARCLEVQKRVEKMLGSVERRRRERMLLRHQSAAHWPETWDEMLQLVHDELMTPPDRFANDPIVLKEELQAHVILQDVSFETVSVVQSSPAKFPGVHIQTTNIRSYPQSSLGAHLIGVRRAKAQQAGQRHGESGIERFHASRLDGQPGLIRHVKNRRGEELEMITDRNPVDGQDVVLTVDSRLQAVAEGLLDGALQNFSESDPVPTGGCLVAMDIWTGDLLTLAASPRVAPAHLVQPGLEEWKSFQNDPRRPLFPRGTQMALPPGSLFKIVTAAAALEAGVVTAEEFIPCRGYLDESQRYRCPLFRQQGIGHGELSLSGALGQNCHVYFYELSRRLPAEELCDWGKKFGFGALTGIDLPYETPGALPDPREPDGSKWYPGSSRQMAIGQGALLVTPLQVARMMAAIANGGYLVTPRVAQVDERHRPDHPYSGMRRIDGLSRTTLAMLQQALGAAMRDPLGESRAGQVEMLPMAALAATASGGGARDHAWFAGYAPADRPRVAFAIVLEGGASATRAGVLLRQYLTELLGLGYLTPFAADASQTRDDSSEGIDPVARAGNTGADFQ
jgi:penicillin-binding protein 2